MHLRFLGGNYQLIERRQLQPLFLSWGSALLILSMISPWSSSAMAAKKKLLTPSISLFQRWLLILQLGLVIAVEDITSTVKAAPQEALIAGLPGFSGDFNSLHYSGYITVNEEHGRSLFYYLVTSENDPVHDPLVVWLNGGPGCSSFDGFVYEHGPFNFIPAGDGITTMPTLVHNPYTWAKVANMLYVDSPAGVGFSYSNVTADYTTGDLATASDLHKFLLRWIEDYPEFSSNSLYISGESYAGIYVPTFTREIFQGLQSGIKPSLNLKGYLIGNGCTDEKFDGDAFVPFVYGMGLISIDLHKSAVLACHGSYWNATDPDCLSKLDVIHQEVQNLNIYDILEPCYHTPATSEDERIDGRIQSFLQLGKTDRSLPVRRRMFGRAWPLRSAVKDGLVPSWYKLSNLQHLPCLDTHVASVWLNNASVRQAIHALPESKIGKWLICADQLTYFHNAGSMIPIHRALTSKGYRALIYSGDHDMCVPFTGSEAWTRSLGYEVVDQWRPWYVGGQVAGYTTSYANKLTFATAKGSGHTVPEYKPKEALALFQRWLGGAPL